MRQRLGILTLLLLLAASVASAATPNTPIRAQRGLGRQQFTPAASTALTLPSRTKHAYIVLRNSAAYVTTDGTAASAVNGTYFPVGTVFIIENDAAYLADFRFISTEEGATVVYAEYSGDR